MKAMKDQAIVCNIGHFDNEIQVDALYASGATKTNIAAGRQVHVWQRQLDLPDSPRPPGQPRLRHRPPELRVMSNSFSNQTLARRSTCGRTRMRTRARSTSCRRSWTRKSRACTWKIGELTKLTQSQADYLGVAVEGP